MKSVFNRYACLVATIVCVSLAGCEKAGETAPVFSILCDEDIIVSSEASEINIRYEIENAGTNPAVKAKSDVDWVSFNVGTDAVVVSVDENSEMLERQCTITVTYTDDEDANIAHDVTLIQSGSEVLFNIELGKTGSTWQEYSISPANSEMKYMVTVRSVSEMESYASDEDLYNADMADHRYYAELDGLTLMEYLEKNGVCKSGMISSQYKTLIEPDTEYCIYCYGIDGQASICSAINKEFFTTTEVCPVDNEIAIEIPEDMITDTRAKAYFKPSTMDTYVYSCFIKEEGLTEEFMVYFLSMAQAVAGDQEVFLLGQQPNTTMVVAAMGVAGGIQTTELFTQEFKTQEIRVNVEAKVFDGDDVFGHTGNAEASGKFVVAQKVNTYWDNVWSVIMPREEYTAMFDEIAYDPDFHGIIYEGVVMDEDVHIEMMNRLIASGEYTISRERTPLWMMEEEGEYAVLSLVKDGGNGIASNGTIIEVVGDKCSPIDEYDSFLE